MDNHELFTQPNISRNNLTLLTEPYSSFRVYLSLSLLLCIPVRRLLPIRQCVIRHSYKPRLHLPCFLLSEPRKERVQVVTKQTGEAGCVITTNLVDGDTSCVAFDREGCSRVSFAYFFPGRRRPPLRQTATSCNKGRRRSDRYEISAGRSRRAVRQ